MTKRQLGWPTHMLVTGVYRAPRSSPQIVSTVVKSGYAEFTAHASWIPRGWGRRLVEGLRGVGLPNSEEPMEACRWTPSGRGRRSRS